MSGVVVYSNGSTLGLVFAGGVAFLFAASIALLVILVVLFVVLFAVLAVLVVLVVLGVPVVLGVFAPS